MGRVQITVRLRNRCCQISIIRWWLCGVIEPLSLNRQRLLLASLATFYCSRFHLIGGQYHSILLWRRMTLDILLASSLGVHLLDYLMDFLQILFLSQVGLVLLHLRFGGVTVTRGLICGDEAGRVPVALADVFAAIVRHAMLVKPQTYGVWLISLSWLARFDLELRWQVAVTLWFHFLWRRVPRSRGRLLLLTLRFEHNSSWSMMAVCLRLKFIGALWSSNSIVVGSTFCWRLHDFDFLLLAFRRGVAPAVAFLPIDNDLVDLKSSVHWFSCTCFISIAVFGSVRFGRVVLFDLENVI